MATLLEPGVRSLRVGKCRGEGSRGGSVCPPHTHTHRAAAVPNATPWAADAAEPPLRP